MNIVVILILLGVALLALALFFLLRDSTKEQKGSCGISFRVLDLEDKKGAAEIFCELDRRAQILRRALRGLNDERAKRIIQFYEPSDLTENAKET